MVLVISKFNLDKGHIFISGVGYFYEDKMGGAIWYLVLWNL